VRLIVTIGGDSNSATGSASSVVERRSNKGVTQRGRFGRRSFNAHPLIPCRKSWSSSSSVECSRRAPLTRALPALVFWRLPVCLIGRCSPPPAAAAAELGHPPE